MPYKPSKSSRIRRALRKHFPVLDGKPSLVETIENTNLPLRIAVKKSGYPYDKVCLFLANRPSLGLLTDYRETVRNIRNKNRKPKYH